MISWFQCDDHKREHRLKFEQPRRLVHVSKNVVQLIQEYKNMYYLISKTQIMCFYRVRTAFENCDIYAVHLSQLYSIKLPYITPDHHL